MLSLRRESFYEVLREKLAWAGPPTRTRLTSDRMLSSIEIQGLALVERLTPRSIPRSTCSPERPSGKSLILGSIGLLLASAPIRTGSRRRGSRVRRGVFDLAGRKISSSGPRHRVEPEENR